MLAHAGRLRRRKRTQRIAHDRERLVLRERHRESRIGIDEAREQPPAAAQVPIVWTVCELPRNDALLSVDPAGTTTWIVGA